MSLVLGVIVGGAIAALLFGLTWLGVAFDRGEMAPPSNVLFAAVAAVSGFEALGWARRSAKEPVKAVLLSVAGVLLVLSLPATLWFELRDAELAPWITDRDFATLVVMSVCAGVLALGSAARFSWHGRIAQFPVAAIALWFASDWAVKLGPPVSDFLGDPRRTIAVATLFGVGALALVSVLVAMDWHIKMRDRVERDEIARLHGETGNG